MAANPLHAAAAAAAEHDLDDDDDTQSWAPAPRDVCAELLAKHKWSRTAESSQVRHPDVRRRSADRASGRPHTGRNDARKGIPLSLAHTTPSILLLHPLASS
jgi:hypothetical protein